MAFRPQFSGPGARHLFGSIGVLPCTRLATVERCCHIRSKLAPFHEDKRYVRHVTTGGLGRHLGRRVTPVFVLDKNPSPAAQLYVMNGTFLCCLCEAEIEIRQTKKGKPYMICEDCGVQIFVRYQKGVRRLEQLSSNQASLLEEFILCRRCDVAVRNTSEKIQDPLFGDRGFYCPECGELLLEVQDDEW